MGEDAGALSVARHLASKLGVAVAWECEYQPFDCFVAALAAADVVVCPYRVSSRSGVIALAEALGRPTVATSVGALCETTAVLVPPGDVEALAAAVDTELAGRRQAAPAMSADGVRAAAGPDADRMGHVARAYLSAYGRAAPSRRRRRAVPRPKAQTLT